MTCACHSTPVWRLRRAPWGGRSWSRFDEDGSLRWITLETACSCLRLDEELEALTVDETCFLCEDGELCSPRSAETLWAFVSRGSLTPQDILLLSDLERLAEYGLRWKSTKRPPAKVARKRGRRAVT